MTKPSAEFDVWYVFNDEAYSTPAGRGMVLMRANHGARTQMPNDFTRQFLKFADTLGAAVVEAAILSFVAVRRDDQFFLIEGQLILGNIEQVPKASFQSPNVRAGQYRLSDLGKSVAQLLWEVDTGSLKLPEGEILLQSYEGGGYHWSFDPSHALGGQTRLEILTVLGREREALVDERLVDWELRAAVPPFDTLVELTNHYGLIYTRGSVRFEAAAPAIVAVDITQRVDGESATLGLVLFRGFATDRAFLGYKILVNNNCVERGQSPGSAFKWNDDGKIQRGIATLQVPRSAIVHCFAGYDGRAQSFGWIVDPNNHQNARRVAYEGFDKDLAKLRDGLLKAPGPAHKNQQGIFEAAVSSLMWIRGYGVSLLSTIKEGPDILATTPSGHFLVIECTMGILKEDSKLTRLAIRAKHVRDHLKESGSPNLSVLPVMITALTRSEVETEIAGALQQGTFVITREAIEESLETSFLVPDPEREFNDALKLLAEAASQPPRDAKQ
ncbi:hypothetical protein [Rhizobium sp. A37_96]